MVNHGQSFVYDDTKYTYIASGLCRYVFKSECGKFVIKVPIGDVLSNSEITDVLEYVKTKNVKK
jgi:hypothetical protein